MEKIVEIENFLPLPLQDHVYSIVSGINFPWYHVSDVTFDATIGGYSQLGFHNTPVLNGIPHSKEWDALSFLVPLIIEESREHYGKKKLQIDRVRIGMNVPSTEANRLKKYNAPHVDHNPEFAQKIKTNLVALYYVNDCKGDTFIFNETQPSKEWTIQKTVSPKKGKLVFFDGNYYHSSSSSKSDNARIVISVNLHEY